MDLTSFLFVSVKRSSRPVIESFELQENESAYIGSKVNLTCKINNAEAAIFRKAGVTIRECGRFTFFFENYGGDGLVGNLEIIDVAKEDEGVFTCYAFQEAGYLVNKTFTLKTGLYHLLLLREYHH